MTIIKDRQKDILGWVVREYTKISRPVASSDIVREFHLKVSPATIRSEMLELDHLGYLNQPHTSAGRVPTDRGYRFFIDNLLEDAPLTSRKRSVLKETFEEEDEDKFTRELARLAASITRNLTLCGLKEILYKRGFTRLLEEPEFGSQKMVRSLGRLLDRLDDEMQYFVEDLDESREAVFVGEENPLEEGRDMSMIITEWTHPEGFSGFLALIGPKRMDYQKNLSFVRYLHHSHPI